MHSIRDNHQSAPKTGLDFIASGSSVDRNATQAASDPDPASSVLFEALMLAKVLTGYRYTYTHEADLQVQIAEALSIAGIHAIREVEIGPGNRIDFMVGRTGIEVKVDGSLPQALRQVDRYLRRDEIDSVLVASTKIWATQYPGDLHTLRGKPVRILRLARSFV